MSHSKERAEKNCLNCNAVLHGRYCSICGQENLEPQESVWHMVGHFFSDITHFDGKFFSSVKYLFTRPGFLTKEYVNGRRASYLNPVRMYVFTSAIFFLIFFSFFSGDEIRGNSSDTTYPVISRADSARFRSALFLTGLDSAKAFRQGPAFKKFFILIEPDSSGFPETPVMDTDKSIRYESRTQYDSLIAIGKLKPNFLERLLKRREFAMREKYGNDDRVITDKIVEAFQHNIPWVFFLSLPVFALFLKLLYRRNKKFYYTAHIVFSLHLYIFAFIAVLLLLCLNALSELRYFNWIVYPLVVLWLLVFYYAYKAMRNFYGQGRIKTFFKFFFSVVWLSIVIIIFMGLVFLFSLFKS